MKKKLGDSSVQRDIEKYVLEKIRKSGIGSVSTEDTISTNHINTNQRRFEVDFHIKNKVLGEIYACKYKLQSAQTKKVHSDLLKMITIENDWGKSVSKFFIMALSFYEDEVGKYPISARGKFIRARSSKNYINTLGENSWIWKTIEDFDFEIYYIILPEKLSKNLVEQRKRQKEAIRKI